MNRKNWKNKHYRNPAASEFHELFRQFLLTEPRLKNLRCYQEINVQDLMPSYEYPNHHYDWYIDELDIIVELHGSQHYKMSNFGNIGYSDMEVKHRNMLYRDNLKRTIAQENGHAYAVVPYQLRNKLSYELLLELTETI